ncbi:protein kinase domain-containing protein [Myxococcus vastator]|uniref:protein kinase domain-containing protein n=1 Tax=Myxococcus vastator TaxID=2709664 RepID=UPI0013D7FC24|nr:protein kinase [Myxococcus vastator]
MPPEPDDMPPEPEDDPGPPPPLGPSTLDLPPLAPPTSQPQAAPAAGAAGAVLELGGSSGSYELVRRLGKGGMAEVHLGRRLGTEGFERPVAIKRIIAERRSDSSYRKMFLDEARLAARLVHRNIAQVFDLHANADGFYLVMEYVPGTSLRDLIAMSSTKGRAFTEAFALYVTSELAAALHYAHAATDATGKPLGIVHRDVTPHNVMISESGDVKLLDFGIALSAVPDRERTSTGFIKGKYAYMAPEHALAEPNLDGRADLFSLGLVLVELLTWRRIFEEPSTAATLLRVTTASQEDITAAIKQLPEALQDLIRKALARKRDDRHASCEAFRAELRKYMKAAGILGFGPEEAAAELKALATDTPRGTTPSRRAARPTPAAPPPAAVPPAAAARVAAAPAAATASPPPAVAAPPPAAPARASDTRQRRMLALREDLANPKGATRKLLLVPALSIGGMLLGGFLVVSFFVSSNTPDVASPVEVKTAAQERAEREAAAKELQPAPATAVQLADVRDTPVQAASPAPATLPPPTEPRPQRAPKPQGAKPTSRPAVAAAAPAPTDAPPAVEAAPPPRARRNTLRSMAMGSATVAEAPSSSSSVPAGTFIPVKLQVPVDPFNPGPVTFTVTKAVASVPAGATGICTPQGGATGRVGLSCTSLTLPERGAVSVVALAYGTDRQPGLPYAQVDGASPGASSDARNVAVNTAQRLAGDALGNGTVGDVARDALGVGASRARSTSGGSGPTSQPIPRGTGFLLFVSEAF